MSDDELEAFRKKNKGEVPITKCPIRGHDHDLRIHRHITQIGTGEKAVVFECPSGMYRWFCVVGNQLSNLCRSKRPRWGWKDKY